MKYEVQNENNFYFSVFECQKNAGIVTELSL